jgi:hypothetical protein
MFSFGVAVFYSYYQPIKQNTMLHYSLAENLLTAAASDFMALPLNVRTYTLDDIARRILARHPGMGQSQLNAAIEEFIEEVCIITEDGAAVNTPLFNTHPSISGVFDNATDTFDPKRHRAKTNLTPGTRLRDAAARMKTQKEQTPDPKPFIIEVTDIVSNTVNDRLTPGGVIQVKGGRLKLAATNPDNGIFLLHGGNAVKLDVMVENKPSRLIAMLPATLQPGVYYLEVRTTLSSSNRELKAMRTNRFEKELTAL